MNERHFNEQQAEFMDACNQPRYPIDWLLHTQDIHFPKEVLQNVSLWLGLINEEVNTELRPFLLGTLFGSLQLSGKEEKLAALERIADDIADSIYVLCGLANCLGLPLAAIFAEVHRSNMTKAVDGKVIKRSDGKILKPAGWTPPDIYTILKATLKDGEPAAG